MTEDTVSNPTFFLLTCSNYQQTQYFTHRDCILYQIFHKQKNNLKKFHFIFYHYLISILKPN